MNRKRHTGRWLSRGCRRTLLSAAYDKVMAIAKKSYTSRYRAVSGRTVQCTVLGLSRGEGR